MMISNLFNTLKFEQPATLTEEEYLSFKTKGVQTKSTLPNFLLYNLLYVLLLTAFALAYHFEIFGTYSESDTMYTMTRIGSLMLIYVIAKRYYYYIKYYTMERAYLKKLRGTIENSNSYLDFRYKYDQITANPNSVNIKVVETNASSTDINNETKGKAVVIYEKAFQFLQNKEKNEEDVVRWMINQGLSQEKSETIVHKIQEQIEQKKSSDKKFNIWEGTILILLGALFVFNKDYYGIIFMLYGGYRIAKQFPSTEEY